MNYKGILLDLDNTLYNYDASHAIALDDVLNRFSKRFGLSLQDSYGLYEHSKKMNHRQLALTAASHSRLFYFQKMLEQIGAFDIGVCLELDALYWQVFLGDIKPEPYAMELLKDLHVPKCIVTDFTAEPQLRKLMKLEMDMWIDHLVTSEEAGVEKPHPFIYMLALSKLGLKAHEVIMIGDSYEKDCLGASTLGIDSILYKGNAEKSDEAKGITVLQSFHDIIHWLE